MAPRYLSYLGLDLLNVPIGVWLGSIALVLIARLYPELDLAVSRLFYVPGEGFLFKGSDWEQALYHSVPILTLIVNLGLVVLWRFNRHLKRPWLGLDGRRLIFLLVLLALIPGVVVNQMLKGHWGRPRPIMVTEFGGHQRFTPAFVPSDQGGASLSSGHTAAAAYLTVAAATLRGGRSPWVWLAGLYTGAVGLARIAAGGHFLTDVLASILLVWIAQGLLRGVIPIR